MIRIPWGFTAVLLGAGFCHVYAADAATILAESCEQPDIQAAIDSAADGDTVLIPDGECQWTATGDWGAPAVSISNKEISLKGNGLYAVDADHQDVGTWPLVITLDSPDGHSGLEISGASGQMIRVTGIHFTGSCPGGTSGFGAIRVPSSNASGSIRIDNCKFTVSGNAVSHLSSGLGGLVDHVYSYNPDCSTSGMVTAMDQRNDATGGWAFTQPIQWGSAGFFFIEDSTFWRECTSASPATTATDAQAGGKFVFRHNHVKDAMIVWHGTESGYPQRGGYAFEIYGNEIFWTMPDNRYHCAIFHRGGTALIYDNAVTNYQALWKTWVRRAEEPFGEFGRCDGTQAHDGNLGGSYPAGYPCLDQVGRGRTSGMALSEAQPQEESKCTIWNNTRTNTDTVYHNDPAYVVEGRDYEFCDDASCAPADYAPFEYPHPLTAYGTTCVNDEDCTSPPQCRSAEGATCSGDVCWYPPSPAGTGCDDGNGCTEPDTCDGAGTCIPGPDVCAGDGPIDAADESPAEPRPDAAVDPMQDGAEDGNGGESGGCGCIVAY